MPVERGKYYSSGALSTAFLVAYVVSTRPPFHFVSAFPSNRYLKLLNLTHSLFCFRQIGLYTRTGTAGECSPFPGPGSLSEIPLGAFLGQTCGSSSVAGAPITTGLGCLGDSRRAGDAAFAVAFASCGSAPPAPLNATAVCGTRRSQQPGTPSTTPPRSQPLPSTTPLPGASTATVSRPLYIIAGMGFLAGTVTASVFMTSMD